MSLLQKPDPRRLELISGAFYLGLISLSIQVSYARLAVGFAGGNEVYLSLFFFFWLLFTSTGAFFIKKVNPSRLFLILAFLTPVSALVFFLSPRIAGIIPGQLIPPFIYTITIIITLLPICLINGGLFSSIASNIKGSGRSGRTYWGEAFGALIGGVITTIYYVSGGRDYSFLIFIAFVCLIAFIRTKASIKAIVFIACIMLLVFGAGDPLENLLLKIRFRPYIFLKSVSGRLVRYDSIKTKRITSLYSGGIKIADFPDEITGQELFYWPYLVKPDMSNIALVRAESHMVDRFIPSHIKRLYIYPERSWRELIKPEYLPSDDNCQVNDPVVFFRETRDRFDAIILNLGPLLSLYDYRLETRRFFGFCKDKLTGDGVLSVSVSAYDGLWCDDLKQRLVSIYNILKDNFINVYFIPGQKITFICGDNIDIALTSEELINRYNTLQIDSPYFNPALIRSRTNPFKTNQVQAQLNQPVRMTGPLSIGYGLSYYFSQFGFKYNLKRIINLPVLTIITVIILFLILMSSGFHGKKFLQLLNIFYFGVTSFILEIIVLFYTQLLGGYLYIALGIILGLFMIGMALGAFLGTHYNKHPVLPKNKYNGSLVACVLFVLLSGLLLLTPGREWILLMIVTMAGFAGGLGFTSSSKPFDTKPGLPYAVDLGGAMIGTLAGLAILISALPFRSVFYIICLLGVVLFATNRWARK